MCVSSSRADEELDITKFEISFEENFDALDVTPWGTKPSRWIAHTPWNGDFGDAKFSNPTPGFPFVTNGGILRIEARKFKDEKWQSGLLASVNRDHIGFSQIGGYFEARMKFPEGPGVWPAFWLVGTDRTKFVAEIDVVEFYGHTPGRFSSKRHIWRSKFGGQDDSLYKRTDVPMGSLSSSYHTYGVRLTPDYITYYFDRKQIWRTDTPPEYLGISFFPLVNLALGSGWSISDTPNPSFLYVDYVHVYKERK